MVEVVELGVDTTVGVGDELFCCCGSLRNDDVDGYVDGSLFEVWLACSRL